MNPTNIQRHQPFVLPGTWTATLTGDTARYRIHVATPASEPPPGGFPVLYLLDANAGFATVVETHRRLSRRPDATRVAPAIIVGISQDSEALYDASLRQRDFADEQGARAFLDFIQHTVKPLIRQHEQINAQRQILAGHSLAGLFTLRALQQQPDAFQSYIALSPSLWSDNTLITRLTAMLSACTLQHLPQIFLAVGEWEEGLAPWQPGQPGSEDILARRLQRGMVSQVKKLGELLQQQLGNERCQYTVFPQEDHASVFAIGMSRAMRMLLQPSAHKENNNL